MINSKFNLNKNKRGKKMKHTIQGGNLPVALITLEAGESLITEKGGMSWIRITSYNVCYTKLLRLMCFSMPAEKK